MNQQDFLALIQASQSTLKQELLARHPESKYQLLMLSRSFDLLKQYLIEQENYNATQQQALEQYFHLPVENIDEGRQQLSQDLRHLDHPQILDILNQLNQADLSITAAKGVKNG